MEANARLLTVPLHGEFGYSAHRRDFGEPRTTEEFEVNTLSTGKQTP